MSIEHTEYLEVSVLPTGDLRLALTPNAARDEIFEQYDDTGEVSTLAWLFEPLASNGSYAFVDSQAGNPFVGLTSAPCIAEQLSYDDDGNAQVEGRLWWFPDYQVRGVIDELLEKGEVVFSAAPTDEPSPRRPSP